MLALACDTTCALSREEARALGVELVPMSYVVDGRRYAEAPMGENGDYAKLLRRCRTCSTEPPSPAAFARAFRELAGRGDEVLCLTISSRLSGAFRAAQEAASGMDGVTVLDSWTTSAALELLVRRARALADEGRGAAEVVDALVEERERAGIAFAVPDMGTLRRSGRLGALRRSLTSMLNHRPVMELARGGIVELGSANGASGVGRLLAEQVPVGAREAVLVHFGSRGSDARHVLLALRQRLPRLRVRMKDGGPVLTENLGDGAVALAWR